ncbi:substrate-binding periplasmic protein [Paradevosia shaoguanensis]|uniref:substrate-binding periplasmic protein n=1 Tax=Paradevosia shaoguanensis TaxID=1335043 RepID=UPI003C708A18
MTARLTAALAATLLMAAPTQAQNVEGFRPLFEDRLHQQGDGFSLCVNTLSMTADFERALAQAIGDILLTDVKIIDIEPAAPPRPLDTALPYTAEQIYILMAEQCDGFFGFTVAAGYPDWLTISYPYLVGNQILVTRDQAYNKLEDVPRDRPIGSRFGTDGDASLITYLQSLPESARWKRFGYGENKLLLDRLNDGTVAAAVIWEPTLQFATSGDPKAAGYKQLEAPFKITSTQVGIGIRTIDSYLKEELGDAIKALIADGTMDTLLKEHHLAGDSSTPQTELSR